MKPQSISTAKLFLIAISLLLFQYATAQNNCPLCKIPNADFVFNNNDILSNQTFMDFVIEINGTVYIDGSCEFYGCYIYLSEQARIELLPGPTELILRYNEFYDCCLPHYAWDGIYTTDQENYIFAGNNYFRHGENVFVEAFGAEVILNFNEFDRCYYPLTLQDWAGVPRIEFRGNYIQSILPITAQPAPPNNIPTNGKTPVGIRIINYVSTGSSLLTIGDATAYSNFNSFVEIFTAIESLNSDVRIINNKVLYSEFGFICFNPSSPQHFRFIIGGTGTFEGNILWDINEVGTHVYGNVELSIENNLIDGGTRTGILLSNVDVNSTVAMIQYNEMHLGKHNAGSIPRNFKGIHIHGSTGSIDISFNFINTKTLNGIPLAIGEGIDVSSSGGSGNRIDIFSNIIENVRYGIRARILLSETELTIAANRIEFTTAADEYGEAGIFIFFCYQIIGEIINNFIENYISGI